MGRATVEMHQGFVLKTRAFWNEVSLVYLISEFRCPWVESKLVNMVSRLLGSFDCLSMLAG